jgi:hypothetical protein
MAKKRRRMRTSLRAASKVQERGLTSIAERLAEQPALAIPECRGHASHFKRARKHVLRAWDAREDEDRLAKLARRGHPIARAFAATLFVGLYDPENVVMQNVKTPLGTVAIASRGGAKGNHLLGLQHLEDRRLRLFLVVDLVRRKRLTFYAMPAGGLACAGKEGKPPPEFVQAEAQELGLLKDPEGWGCPHAVQAGERVVLKWKPAGLSLRRCGACAEGNMLHRIVERIAARNVTEAFDVRVELEPLRGPGAAALPASTPTEPAALERYRKGELDDRGLLAAQRAARLVQLRALPGPLFVNDLQAFGSDAGAFIASLKPTPLEAAALRGALEGYAKPVVAERGTPAKVLAELWPERGLAALEAVAGSAEVAREVHAKHDLGAKGVGPALQQAQQRGSRQATDAALPTYRDLPPGPKLADAVARAHRAHGRQAALAALEQGEAPALKGLAHAFELALGAPRAWKYAPLDVELAQQLRPHAERLLAAPPAEYHGALAALARAMGVSEELRRAP